MVSSYTTRKRLEKQNPGENNNSWGGFLNTNTIELIDECFGTVCVAMTTAGDSNLSQQSGSSDEGRRTCLILTGAPTSNVRLFVPAVQSFYLVRNKMTGAFRVRITNSGQPTGNGVDFSGTGSGAEQGAVISDGTNVREVMRTVSAGALTIFTKGMIMPFFNSVGALPSGWAICDGTNGTPNLNDRFIIGTASATNVDTSGGSLALTAASNGDHAHGGTVVSTALVSSHIPKHQHYIIGNFGGVTGNDSLQVTGANCYVGWEGGGGTGDSYDLVGEVTTAIASHGLTSPNFGDPTTANPHTHTVNTGGGHQHTITDGRPPYHRMYYIMKL